jgi:DNA processing protein
VLITNRFLPGRSPPGAHSRSNRSAVSPSKKTENNSCQTAIEPLSNGMDSREAFIALNLVEGVGPVRARSLLEHFGEAPKILAASKTQLLRVRNIGDDVAENISGWEKSIDLAGELKRIADFGSQVLVQSDENYPAALR